MEIVLNRRGGVPVREQIVTQLKLQILGGALAHGQRLPSVRALARSLRVHHNQNQKIRTRTAVAVNVIALVERQIGLGEGPLEEEWGRLREITKDQPKALALVENLKVAIDKYDDEIRTKSREAEADEPAMRKAANGVIRGAIMAKLKSLQDLDREEEARAADETAQQEEPPK